MQFKLLEMVWKINNLRKRNASALRFFLCVSHMFVDKEGYNDAIFGIAEKRSD